MKIPRRRLLSLAGAGAIFPSIVTFARAESYPTRPIRFVVGFPVGGPNDILARLIGQWLSERLGHSVIVENTPSSSRTDPALRVTWQPKPSCVRRLTGIRC
jgi:tripartite-type tricarboxylate transporter receptor subunit TctC